MLTTTIVTCQHPCISMRSTVRFDLSLSHPMLQALPYQLDPSVHCCFHPTVTSVTAKTNATVTPPLSLQTQQFLYFDEVLADLHCCCLF